MEIKNIQEAMKAILFVSGDPVSIDRIADALELDRPTAAKILQSLADECDAADAGILIVRVDDQYQMCSNPKFAQPIYKVMDSRRNTPISPAGMEVLAIVAYNQPVTKAFVEQIRGVDCSGVFSSLCAKGLIEERGRLELPGRPLLYGTTANFLRCLNITSLSELPPLPEKQAEEEKAGA